ncbi:hypothetical protein KI387_009142, partial [Taxus chinensis]
VCREIEVVSVQDEDHQDEDGEVKRERDDRKRREAHVKLLVDQHEGLIKEKLVEVEK